MDIAKSGKIFDKSPAMDNYGDLEELLGSLNDRKINGLESISVRE